MSKATKRAAKTVRAAADELERRVMAMEGRRSVRGKVAAVKRVAKKALKAAAVAGAVAVVTSVARERSVRSKRSLG